MITTMANVAPFFTSGNVATPRVLLRALVERWHELERVELVHLFLIEIAHPRFREALTRAARERYLL